MSSDERRARMRRLFQQVEEQNIYRWAASFLTKLAATRTAGGTPERKNMAVQT